MKTDLVMHVLNETILDMMRIKKCDVTDLSKTAIRERLVKDGNGASNTTNGPMIDEAKILIGLAAELDLNRIYVGLKAGYMREMRRIQDDSCAFLKKIIAKNAQEHEQLRLDHRELLNEHRELNDKFNDEQKKCLALDKENAGLRSEVSTLNKTEVDLKNQLGTVRKDLVEKTADVAVTKSELKVAHESREDALTMVKALESDLRSAEGREQSAINNRKLAEQRLDMLEEQFTGLKATKGSLEARNRELEDEIRTIQQGHMDAAVAEAAATARLDVLSEKKVLVATPDEETSPEERTSDPEATTVNPAPKRRRQKKDTNTQKPDK